jgi:hypothetical protein
LALFGILFSTVSAHFKKRPDYSFATTALAVGGARSTRPRRSRQSSSRPLSNATVCASYARFSSENQSELSIPDQQRKCKEWLSQKGYSISADFEYSDVAISGTKLQREGLDALIAAAKSRCFSLLVIEHVSRLARELAILLPLLKELVEIYDIRIVSVNEGIDSTNQSWATLVTLSGLQSGEYLRYLSAAVFRGQEGNTLRDFSNGDWCFGYRSEPIPGTEIGRGRIGKPRMRVVIDPEESLIVTQIFTWFVVEKRTISWIVKELTRRGIKKDHRATTPGWHHHSVRRILSNCKYVGIWSWGKSRNKRNPLNGKITQVERPDDESSQWIRSRSDLRIVEQTIFDAAQEMLAENEAKMANYRKSNGQLAGSGNGIRQPRHLLQGMFRCACGRSFNTCGGGRAYMGCTGYRLGLCKCRTRIERAMAERILLNEIGRLIHEDPMWTEAVLRECELAWQQQITNKETIFELEKQCAVTNSKIARLLDRVEDDDPDPDVAQRIKERRVEKVRLEAKITELRHVTANPPPAPTKDWVVEQLNRLDEVVRCAGPAAAIALRKLVGGNILVSEHPRPTGKRMYLRAHIHFDVRAFAHACAGANPKSTATEGSKDGREVTIDFVELPVWAKLADQVKELYDADLTYGQIGERLSISYESVSKAFKYWHKQREVPIPPTRSKKLRAHPSKAELFSEAASAL